MSKRIAVKTVTKAIQAEGLVGEMVRGNGYYYFAGPSFEKCKTTMVVTHSISAYDLDGWVNIAKQYAMEIDLDGWVNIVKQFAMVTDDHQRDYLAEAEFEEAANALNPADDLDPDATPAREFDDMVNEFDAVDHVSECDIHVGGYCNCNELLTIARSFQVNV